MFSISSLIFPFSTTAVKHILVCSPSLILPNLQPCRLHSPVRGSSGRPEEVEVVAGQAQMPPHHYRHHHHPTILGELTFSTQVNGSLSLSLPSIE